MSNKTKNAGGNISGSAKFNDILAWSVFEFIAGAVVFYVTLEFLSRFSVSIAAFFALLLMICSISLVGKGYANIKEEVEKARKKHPRLDLKERTEWFRIFGAEFCFCEITMFGTLVPAVFGQPGLREKLLSLSIVLAIQSMFLLIFPKAKEIRKAPKR